MTKLFRMGEDDVQVTVRRHEQGYRVTVDGNDLPWVVRRDGDLWSVDTPAGRRRFVALVTPDRCEVFSEGRTRIFAKPDPDEDAAGVGGDAGPRLTADMPGKIVKVLVQVGDEVSQGQPLVIMESMKMETELAAAVSGTVAEVAVAAGQVIGQGDLLVLVTPEDAES